MFLSVVIAVYNEEGNVKELTDRMYTSLNKLRVPFELVYVVDGTDRSFEILKAIKENKKNMKIDYSPLPRGFKNAFVKGFKMINKKRTTHILTMDADLNHQPEEISSFISKIKSSNADIVIGSRYISGGKVHKLASWKRGISIFANLVIKLLWGLKIKDKTSGYRLYRKEVIGKVVPKCKSENFEFLLEMLIIANRLKYRLSEVPITFKARIYGESKFNLVKVLKGYLKLIVRYY